ncbi:hypothetical protein DY000_02060391 [Brassica cretica]|uniref:Uncharacterized protein n=1 Tax=Brassica cretica TaxID=69181 RepID=A0ABQ7B3F6_BRACR|nr:hypothetical protein DY000_02060391 [Brassica cretica]
MTSRKRSSKKKSSPQSSSGNPCTIEEIVPKEEFEVEQEEKEAYWDALCVRSSNLRTSVSWLNDKVKGIRKLRLNQDELGTVGGQLNSARCGVMVRSGVVGSWAVMGWWDLDMNHQGSVGLGLRQGTQDDVLGLVFGQPKGEEEQLGSYFRKGKKGAVLCPFSLTACAGFSRAVGARKIKRERPAVERREPCGVVSVARWPRCEWKDEERETLGRGGLGAGHPRPWARDSPYNPRVPGRKSIQPSGSRTKVYPVSGLLDENPYNPRFMKDRIHEPWVSEGCISKPLDSGKTYPGSSGFQESTTQGHPNIDCSLPPGADCNIA